MFGQDDLDAYAAIGADAEVMRYLGDGKALSRATPGGQIAMILATVAARPTGLAVEERPPARSWDAFGLSSR